MCKPINIGGLVPTFSTIELEIYCSCGEYILEQDELFCDACGDVCCDRCRTQCFHCGEFICINCASNSYECIKCSMGKGNFANEVFIMIDGVKTKIKNGGFFMSIIEESKVLHKTVTLDLIGKKYKVSYSTFYQKANSGTFDYIAYMIPFGERFYVNGKEVIL